jgi:hypothetical protein
MSKLIKGAIYRMHAIYSDTEKKSGAYLDIICDSELGTGTVIYCHPSKISSNYIDGEWRIGFKTKISKHWPMVSLSLEDYEYKMPIIEKEIIKEVVKEVVIEKEIIININKYEETFIDHAYNYYCKLKNRFFNEFI